MAEKIVWEKWGVCLRASTLTHTAVIIRDQPYKESYKILIYCLGCFEGVQGTCPRPCAVEKCNDYNKCREVGARLLKETVLSIGLARIHAAEEQSKIRAEQNRIEDLEESISICKDQIKRYERRRDVFEDHATRAEKADKENMEKTKAKIDKLLKNTKVKA